MTRVRWLAPAVLAVVAVLGCYNPHLVQGGFTCRDHNVCPDNFHCATNGRCYSGDAGPDVPAAPMCTSTTPDAATCSRPLDGAPCNPTCEYGCSCGWCAVSNGAVTCLTGKPGTKKAGDVCDASNAEDCAPGLYCLAECGTAHCHKYCDPSNGDADCASVGGACSRTAVNGSFQFSVCDFPKTNCDPVSGSGCASGYACYPFGGGVECDCAGTNTGTACLLVQTCAPGYTCIGVGGATICRKTCLKNADCGSGQCLNPSGTPYGYCGL